MVKRNFGTVFLVWVGLTLASIAMGAQGLLPDHFNVVPTTQIRCTAVSGWGRASQVVSVQHLYLSALADAEPLINVEGRGQQYLYDGEQSPTQSN